MGGSVAAPMMLSSFSMALNLWEAGLRFTQSGLTTTGSAVSRFLLVGNAGNRRFVRADSGAGDRFHHLAGCVRIGDPFLVEVVGACGHTLVAFVGVDQAGVTAVQQLEQVVFRLHVLARVPDQ